MVVEVLARLLVYSREACPLVAPVVPMLDYLP
jgi:hypothetical protein